MTQAHPHARPSRRQSGFSLLEALITIVILAVGLLGLAGLQTKIQVTETESYQRAQALLLLQDMADRLSANRASASSYLVNSALGTGDAQPASCTGLTGAARDLCEWSNELKGAAERQSGSGNAIGAMLGARGCIEKIGSNPCIYRITVAWQGITQLSAPSLTCGQNSYGNDGYRRAIASFVSFPTLSTTSSPSC